jgi:hypothetical protein
MGNMAVASIISVKKKSQLSMFIVFSEKVREKARRRSPHAKKINCIKLPSIKIIARYGQKEKLLKNMDHLCL